MDGDKKVDEGYSYADLTIIKIMRALREGQLDLTSVGRALKHLYERLGPPSRGWADAYVFIIGNKVYAELPDEWETTDAGEFGQKVMTVMFGDLFTELRDQEENESILVPKDFSSFVEIDPNVMGGEPVIRDTRIPTSILAQLASEGKSIAEIARLYHPVPREAIEKAIQYEQYLSAPAQAA